VLNPNLTAIGSDGTIRTGPKAVLTVPAFTLGGFEGYTADVNGDGVIAGLGGECSEPQEVFDLALAVGWSFGATYPSAVALPPMAFPRP
jgi:hypothetical protein